MSVVAENQEVRVRGTVQGVGFRPTVYRLALECRLTGEVSNDADGVLMRLSGMQENIQHFLRRLQDEAPPLAQIDAIEASVVEGAWQYRNFTIRQSSHSQGHTDITADAASCRACLDEVLDPRERRYLYPFTNCTHCGPRLSIVRGIPYDRDNTTMKDFPFCIDCREEYSDPRSRRFHAQPIACHRCGPSLLLHRHGDPVPVPTRDRKEQSSRDIMLIISALNAGNIVAIKGIGGFHLCCDASNHQAVTLLRQRKQRYGKPFALMCPDVASIKQHCQLSEHEKHALESAAAPIVLLHKRQQADDGAPVLSGAIAPGSNLLGFMLPYTPLHNVISGQFGKPLVMTSGNRSGEPQITDNQQAIDDLGSIADLIVYHDRDIASRMDDSVVRSIAGKVRLMRRARGYAPKSIQLPQGFQQADNILAFGAELKSTFCLVKRGTAILSQHQGDLEDAATFDNYESNLKLYKTLFEFTPSCLAFDMHPEYLSSKLARRYADAQPLTAMAVQHHHAHIASVMAENQVPLTGSAVLGIALDGLGFGADGMLWGGEFLLADYCQYRRLGRLKPMPMPGGAQAVKQPWRNSYAHIAHHMGWDEFLSQYGETDLAKFLRRMPIATIDAMLAQQLNCPLASSAGRLFDAVAAALGLAGEQVQFEGQAAIELEMLADTKAVLDKTVARPYSFTVAQSASVQPLNAHSTTAGAPSDTRLIDLDTSSIWPELLKDLKCGESKSVIASRFHAGLIDGIINMVDQLRQRFQFTDVALSGGCMQNAILLQGLEQALKERHLNCLTHSTVPANDGGIALGQAAVAAARIITKYPTTNNRLTTNNL